MKQQILDNLFEHASSLFQEGGELSAFFKNFEARPQQQEMLKNVLEAYQHRQITLIEAGTGTGKSLAYLIPAILWSYHHKERTVISTHTISLQEQLIEKDIPLAIQALNLDVKAVLVKGMNNYLCLKKRDETEHEILLFSEEERKEAEKIIAWSETTSTGSRSELPFFPSLPMWERFNAEQDLCTHMKCPHYQNCHFFRARKEAQESQILVVNHYLLFSDLALKKNGDNTILPPYERVILDEAHHLEEIATDYFASKISLHDLFRIFNRLYSEKKTQSNGKLNILKEKVLFSPKGLPTQEIKALLTKLNIDIPALRTQVIHQAIETFDLFSQCIEDPEENKIRIRAEHQETPFWKEHVVPSAQKFLSLLNQFIVAATSLDKEIQSFKNDKFNAETENTRLEIKALSERLALASEVLENFISPQVDPNRVRWIEQQSQKPTHVQVIDAELDISKNLANYLFSKFQTIILCSATLAANRTFSFVKSRLGLHLNLSRDVEIRDHIYDSPFNYLEQALLAVPNDIVSPDHPQFVQSATKKILKIVEASKGGTLILFTSFQMLNQCYARILPALKKGGYTALKQGDSNHLTLLNTFKSAQKSVLFATSTFWEGIDVVGEALRCVIIVKLPFQVPSNPLIQARTEAISSNGGNPFFDYSIPHAIIRFKQGFGRLIRNKKDRGCIVCLDTRLINKPYGKRFLNSLPPCRQIVADEDFLYKQMVQFYKNTEYLIETGGFGA